MRAQEPRAAGKSRTAHSVSQLMADASGGAAREAPAEQ
jgi:hypothetical protein